MGDDPAALTIGISPCPNDTFAFHALLHGMVGVPGIHFDARLEDVETLNRMAFRGELDVTKASYGALPYLLDDYVPLRSGGALGRGCGPLIVVRQPVDLGEARIAIPGRYTTANLLLRLYRPDAPEGIEMRYDHILGAVASGQVEAGLIIHESRFTYPDYGLTRLVDLGEWWEEATRTPIPLGVILAKRTLGDRIPAIEEGIRQSVRHAFDHPDDSKAYVARHARELSESVRTSHIALYVNDYTVDIGADGERAVRELVDRASAAGLIAPLARDPFAVSTTT